MAARQKIRGRPKSRIGVVIKDKMDKTVVVEVLSDVLHHQYKKFIRLRARFTAHDETNACHSGDRVEIVETRPMSKTKRWRVRKVLGRTAANLEATRE